MKKVLTFAAGAALAVTPLAALPHADAHTNGHQSKEPVVVATGLNNPRQLAFSESGALYVAEAGAGGTGPCSPGPESDGNVCFGLSGSVTRIWHGDQRQVVRGLPSIGNEGDGSQAIGPADLAFTGHHSFVLSLGLGADPAVRDDLPHSGKILGTLQSVSLGEHHHGWKHHGRHTGARLHTIADLAAHEAATNPIDNPDSDPTGVLLTRRGVLATDSGGNTLVAASGWGHVFTLAAFPDRNVEFPPGSGEQIPMQSVPTDVVRGPDGALYVSELTGFPFPQGAANIYRIVPGHAPTVYASGLTNVTSLAFDRDGTLYAVEISSDGLQAGVTGALVRVAADGSGGTTQDVLGDLFAPYGVAIRHGSAYVTTGSVAVGAGEVLRIPLH